MTGYDVQLLEQRIAAIEERLGIEGSKTLAEAAAEQAERDNKASGQQFRAKYADREISTKARLDKKLMTTIVVLVDSFNDPATRRAIEYMDRSFGELMDGRYSDEVQHLSYVRSSWGFWEKSDPQFPMTDDEIAAYTEGNDLPIARLPDTDMNSNNSTLMVMSDPQVSDDGFDPLVHWFMENRG